MSIAGTGFGYPDPYFYPQYAGQQNYAGLGQSSHGSTDPIFGASPYTQQSSVSHAPKKKGLFGKVFGAAKALTKGATVNFAKSVLSPKGLLTLGAGIALTVATGGAAAPFLIAAGIGMSGMGIAKNGMAAAQLYAAGQDELAEKALENVGTNVTGLGLSVVGARSMVRGGTGGLKANPEAGYGSSVKQVFSHSNKGARAGFDTLKTTYKADGISGVRSLATDAASTARGNVTNFATTVRVASKSTDELVSLYEKAAKGESVKGLSKGQIKSELNARGFSVKGNKLKGFSNYEAQIAKAEGSGNFARATTLRNERLATADAKTLKAEIKLLQNDVDGLPQTRWGSAQGYAKNLQIEQLEARLAAVQENPSIIGTPISQATSNPFATALTGGTAQLNGSTPGVIPALGGVNANNYDSLRQEFRGMYGQGAF